MPGVCERTFRRYVDRYEDEGLDGPIRTRMGVSRTRAGPLANRDTHARCRLRKSHALHEFVIARCGNWAKPTVTDTVGMNNALTMPVWAGCAHEKLVVGSGAPAEHVIPGSVPVHTQSM